MFGVTPHEEGVGWARVEGWRGVEAEKQGKSIIIIPFVELQNDT